MSKEIISYKKYKEYIKKHYKSGNNPYFNTLYDFLEIHAKETLGLHIIEKLSSFEKNHNPDAFMEILGQNRHKINKITANYLYHKWIRLLLINTYSSDEIIQIQDIPIVFMPMEKAEPMTFSTPNGYVICFTQWYNDLLSGTFQTIVKASKFKTTTTITPQISYEEAADRILLGARFLMNNFTGEFPSSLHLEPTHIYLSDLINNHVQRFILAHEYNHVILGHFNNDKRVKESTQNDLQLEIEADSKAAQMLKLPNNSVKNIRSNSFLIFGIISHFMISDLCKKILGYRLKMSTARDKRMLNIIKILTKGSKEVKLLPELEIFEIALKKV